MWRNKKGISPIVGVILVVAMTVLLAAIAWTYMSGMVSNPGKTYVVQPVVKKDGDWIKVRLEGKDVVEVFSVSFEGSTKNNGQDPIAGWMLFADGKYWYVDNNGTVQSNTPLNIAWSSYDYQNQNHSIKTFTFQDSVNSPQYREADHTLRTGFTLKSSYMFITKDTTPEPKSNHVIVIVTFKDGSSQTFEYDL